MLNQVQHDNKNYMNPKDAKILLIEDEAMNIAMYSLKFRLEGLNLITAATAAEGLRLVFELKPNLLLLDLRLDDGIDGFEVLQKIKGDDAVKNIPVYLLSNVNEKGNREKGVAMGAVDFISKVNSTPDEVVKIVKRKLESLV